MTDAITISGFHYLIGNVVSAFIAGLDCGDYAVDQYGQIVIPVGSDPDGLFGADWLSFMSDQGAYGDAEMAISVQESAGTWTAYVPVTVGLNYTSQGQLLRPGTSAVKSEEGPDSLGKRRRAHMVSALLHNTSGISFGTRFDKMTPAIFRDDGGNEAPVSTNYDGVFWDTLVDDYTFDTMLAWQITRPYPAIVQQIGAFLAAEDE